MSKEQHPCWWIFSNPTGVLRCRVGLQGDAFQVPSVGWTWMGRSPYDDQYWQDDRQIKVETPSVPCLSVEVTLKGEALERKRLCSGIYHIVNETWSAGRQV